MLKQRKYLEYRLKLQFYLYMNENLPHLHNLSSRQMMYLNDHHTLGLLQLEMKNFIDCDDLIDCEILTTLITSQ